ncbi:hypothetical protein DF039_37990, partial [Burkholderia cenocepacia]
MDRLFAYEFSGERQSEVRWGLSGLEDSRGTLLIKKFDVINGDEPGTRVRSSGYDYSVGFTSQKLVDFVVSHQTPEMQDRIRAAQTTEDSRMLLSAVRAIVAQAKAQIAADHDKAKANVALDGAIAAAGTDAAKKAVLQQLKAGGKLGTQAEVDALLASPELGAAVAAQSMQASEPALLNAQEADFNAVVGAQKNANLAARLNRAAGQLVASGDGAQLQGRLHEVLTTQGAVQVYVDGLPKGQASEQAIADRMNAKDYASLAAAQADLAAQQAAQTSLDNLKRTDPGAHIVNPSGQAPIVVKGDGKAKDPGRQQDLDRSKANAALDAAIAQAQAQKDTALEKVLTDWKQAGEFKTAAEATEAVAAAHAGSTVMTRAQGLDAAEAAVPGLGARLGRVDAEPAPGGDVDGHIAKLSGALAVQKPIQEQINKLPVGTESEKAIVARMNAKDYASLAAAQADLAAQQAAQTS